MLKRILVGLCILWLYIIFIPSIAKSECGWVVWTKTEYLKTGGRFDTYWEINYAYPKYDRCLETSSKLWRAYKKEADDAKSNNDTIEKITIVPNVLVITRYKDPKEIMSVSKTLFCLPGTLDPRERK